MKTLLLIISILLFGISFSQTTFIVKTKDGQPAYGAVVSKSGSIIGKTNEQGKFTVANILKGEVLEFRLEFYDIKYTAPSDNPKKNQKILLDTRYNTVQTELTDNPYYKPTVKPTVDKKLLEEKTYSDVYTDVDEIAEFPGGKEAMKSFVNAKIKNPNGAIEGKCYLRFIVLENGSIVNTRITRGVPDCPECDQEAIRVVKMMPKWKAGKIADKKVKSYFDIVILFSKGPIKN